MTCMFSSVTAGAFMETDFSTGAGSGRLWAPAPPQVIATGSGLGPAGGGALPARAVMRELAHLQEALAACAERQAAEQRRLLAETLADIADRLGEEQSDSEDGKIDQPAKRAASSWDRVGSGGAEPRRGLQDVDMIGQAAKLVAAYSGVEEERRDWKSSETHQPWVFSSGSSIAEGGNSLPATQSARSFRMDHLSPELSRMPSFGERWEKTFESHKSFHWVGTHVRGIHSRLFDLEEPKRVGIGASILKDKRLNFASGTIILLNSIFLIYTTDYEIAHLGEQPTNSMVAIECMFLAWYTLELVLKFMVHGLYFFWGKDTVWDMFDLVIVVTSCIEMATTLIGRMKQSGKILSNINFTFLRSVRFFKLARLLRVFRGLQFVMELRLLLHSLIGSIINFFWSMVLLALVIYFFALLFVQAITDVLKNESTVLPDPVVETAMSYFGSVGQATIMLLQSVTGGCDWGGLYDLFIAMDHWWLTAAYVFYVLFFAIAFWNILTSAFVDKALRCAQPDLESLALTQRAQNISDGGELLEILRMLDTDNSDTISFQEFYALAYNQKLRQYLTIHNIDIKNVESLFNILSAVAKSDEVPCPIFVNALLRLKGIATSLDLNTFSFETRLFETKMERWMKEVTGKLRNLEGHRVPSSPSRAPAVAAADDEADRRTAALRTDAVVEWQCSDQPFSARSKQTGSMASSASFGFAC
mmetsp:Transcript_123767/g.395480  ORF Transcript_123767/g.395480 Transcript_123767/m.395480 type:complete len:702 (-) Transcript_123767:2-2107(-)